MSLHVIQTTPQVSLQVNYGLWVMVTCRCRSINGNKRTALVGDSGSREAGRGAGAGGGSIWEISVLSAEFSVILKLP